MSQTLLIELLTEELPPKALAKLSDAFSTAIEAGLKSRDLLDAEARTTGYATHAASLSRLPVCASAHPTSPSAKRCCR